MFGLKGIKSGTLSPEKYLGFICLLISFFTILVFASRHYYGLDFYPLNGVFQTHGPVERLAHGQSIYNDFFPYLGASSSLGLYWLSNISGLKVNLANTTVLNEALSCFIFIVSGYFLIQLGAKNKFVSIAVPAIIASTAVIVKSIAPFAFLDSIPAQVSREIIFTGNSNLGLRSFSLYLFAIAAYSATKILITNERNNNTLDFRGLGIISFFGLIAPLFIFWSSDYGTITFLCIPLFFGLLYLLRGMFYFSIVALISLSTGLTVTLLLGYMLDADFILRYINYRTEMQSAQFWFFGASNSGFVFRLADLTLFPALIAGLVMWLVLLLEIFFINRKHFEKRQLPGLIAMQVVIIGTFLAGLGTNLASSQTERYYFPFLIATSFGVFGYSYNIIRMWLDRSISKRVFSGIKLLVLTLLIADLAWIINYVEGFKRDRQSWIYVDKIGAKLPGIYVRDLAWANTNTGQNIKSTFRGYLDYIAGPNLESSQDYIIHALTPDERNSFVNPLRSRKASIVLTPRFDLTEHEAWLRSTAAWFYEILFSNYKVSEQLYDYTVWRPKTDAELIQRVDHTEMSCLITQEAPGKVVLSISPTSETLQSNAGNAYLKVNLDYSSHSSSASYFPGKSRVSASARGFNGGDITFGVPPKASKWSIGVFSNDNAKARVELNASPSNQEIKVTGCEVSFVVRKESLITERSLNVAQITDSNWKQGIAIHVGPLGLVSGLIFENQTLLSGIRPGTVATFQDNTQRKVVWTFDNQVWFDGEALPNSSNEFKKVDFMLR